jgi:hypothetical protein
MPLSDGTDRKIIACKKVFTHQYSRRSTIVAAADAASAL